uniref:Uncharacterized protein, isoform A n=1 Tax=Drosophila melanogaster TaxID=7227 RepID=A0A0B4JCR3_DROME|nr:uncharacterized protein Dmel_CG42782, isoform A [Drosophila melanogaster]NP_001303346.1 uncharacterized protein Dmel_CG42782, isoform B [Drosophila melanogaster]ADV37157.1 uncharacterized protein Dmel_CG42782, isoform A [Drosophila melanogaster]ALI30176.1 uncharacterized protein Dmel_CG42782, isoform B [Drosophila melanogaster]|eukprot:NP_001188910.1 uncharacterized protein Dmel_CG42782, isoform A [Drosophila melanogaster]
MLISQYSGLKLMLLMVGLGMASSYEIIRQCPVHFVFKNNYCQYQPM